MKIVIQVPPKAIWHKDCPKNKFNSGVISILNNDDTEKRSLVECLHCNQKGYLPYGTPFNAEIMIEDISYMESE